MQVANRYDRIRAFWSHSRRKFQWLLTLHCRNSSRSEAGVHSTWRGKWLDCHRSAEIPPDLAHHEVWLLAPQFGWSHSPAGGLFALEELSKAACRGAAQRGLGLAGAFDETCSAR